MQIEIKCIVKNMLKEFWQGGITGQGLDNLPIKEQYDKLRRLSLDLPKNISFKNEQFSRMVDLNHMVKGAYNVTMKKESRKGYTLLTFIFTSKQ